MKDFDAALRLDPGDSLARIFRARLWNRKGEPDKALADLNHVLRVQPKSVLGYIERGDLAIQGRTFQGLDRLERGAGD